MKLNRRQLRRLIESTLYEQDTKGAAIFGALTGVGFAIFAGKVLAETGMAPELLRRATMTASTFGVRTLGAAAGTTPAVLRTLGFGTAKLGQVVAGSLSVAGAAAAGYQIGSMINDYMSGKTGTEHEKMINSFRRQAKDAIDELGFSVLGLEINWDITNDQEYLEKAMEKNYKGLKPNEIDKARLAEIVSPIVVARNFTEDGKLPKELDELFAYRYLDSDAFKPYIEKEEKKMIRGIAEKVNPEDAEKLAQVKREEDLEKLARSGTSEQPGESKQVEDEPGESQRGDINESLSRGSLYRRRYRRY